MQRRKVINNQLKKQGIEMKNRRYLLSIFEKQYDPLLQYADKYGKVKIEKKLFYKNVLDASLKAIGYEFVKEDDELFIKKI